ncbi:MAG: RnfH family protein [Gammaproteobacteria bacterium]|nr:RnfH family protein [Gammaproteobacteria bacterium]
MHSLRKSDAGVNKIEVVYARPHRSWAVELELATGVTAADAAEMARNAEPFMWVEDLDFVGLAVWGKEVPPTYVLRDGDRLELLRPLPVDPMEARRRKAEAQRS